MAAAFRPALQRRGVPQAIYLDNGSAFVDEWLLRGCAVLGIKLIQFLVEVGDGAQIGDSAGRGSST